MLWIKLINLLHSNPFCLQCHVFCTTSLPSLPCPSVPLLLSLHRYSNPQPCNIHGAQSPAKREGRDTPRWFFWVFFFEPSLKIARKFKADIQGKGMRKPAKLLTQPPAIAAILSACADSSADRAGAQASTLLRFQEQCSLLPSPSQGVQSPASPKPSPAGPDGVYGWDGSDTFPVAIGPSWKTTPSMTPAHQFIPVSSEAGVTSVYLQFRFLPCCLLIQKHT